MKMWEKIALTVLAAVIIIGVTGCSGMSRQGKNTAVGAGIGAVGGAILTDGGTLGTLGGAAAGAIIGHEGSK